MSKANEGRFVELLEGHERILWKVAGSYCRNEADRNDLAQEIAVQLWRSFDRYDERYRFSTWMYRVAMNVAISFVRSEQRRTRDEVPFDEPAVASVPAAPPESDDVRQLRAFIDDLDPMNKALIILYLDGNDHATIAEILGITTTNVATKVGRIKDRLRRAFETKGER